MCDNEDDYGDLNVTDANGVYIGVGIVELESEIHYSEFIFTHAQMDLCHINFGTLPGGDYKDKKRSNYKKDEVIKFLEELHGVSKDQPDDSFTDENGRCFRYKEIICSPVEQNKDIEHLLVFDVYEHADDTLISITLFIKD